jgi:hypothetical protein
MPLAQYIWFASAILYNALLAAYCYRLKSAFPKVWNDLGRPSPSNFSALGFVWYRIIRGRCTDIGDQRQAWLAWWVRLTFVLAIILISPPFLSAILACFFSGPIKVH